MADFVSWTAELARWKNAVANRNIDAYFIDSVNNSREMRTMYSKLGSITRYTEWLEGKAAKESAGLSSGQIPFSIGGY